jgi:hypothetical protein
MTGATREKESWKGSRHYSGDVGKPAAILNIQTGQFSKVKIMASFEVRALNIFILAQQFNAMVLNLGCAKTKLYQMKADINP